MNRRDFLKTAGWAGGGLVLAFQLPGCRNGGTQSSPVPGNNIKQVAQPHKSPFEAFVHIATDNKVTLIMPSSEMGQGAHTGLAQMLAEELEIDWNSVAVEQSGRDDSYKNPELGRMITGGSSSIKGWWSVLRQVGAAARTMLVAEAASIWGVTAQECQAAMGKVTCKDKTLNYGELAAGAAKRTVPQDVPLKSSDQYKVIGKAQPRLEIQAKVTGKAIYGIDVKVPDMAYAVVVNAPEFDAQPSDYNKELSGGIKVVPVTGGLAVVGKSYWSALRAARLLKATFKGGATLDSQAIDQQLVEALGKSGQAIKEIGLGAKGLPTATKVLEATYRCPFLDQAPLEPMNCTAHCTKSFCKVWAPTQVQDSCAEAAAKASGLPEDKIEIHTTYLGGGFGRRLEADYVTQAVEASKGAGVPVKMIWTREETTQHGYYRPATVSNFKVGLDTTTGMPVVWTHKIAGPSVFARVFPAALLKGGDDSAITKGARELIYSIANFSFEYCRSDTPVPVGFFRSVAHSHNGFYVECMMDEVAAEGKLDPLELRRRLLKDQPRHLKVLELAAEKAGWGEVAEGRFQGLAICESFGSIVAQVAEISVKDQKVKIHRLVCAVDCGTVINPKMVEAQMEGGVVFGLTAAFKGKITIDKGRVVQANFDTYPLVTLREAPLVETHIVPSQEAPGGMGEPPIPPVAPAVANAIFRATAKRIRSLPFKDEGFTLG